MPFSGDSFSVLFDSLYFRAVFRRFSFRAVRYSFFAVYNSFSLPCRFPADTPTVLFFYRRLFFCAIFKGGFSVRTKKSISGDSLSVSFSVEYLSVPFLKEISGSLPFSFSASFKEGVSWDSHSEYTRPSFLAIVHRLRKTRALLYSAEHASVQKRAHCFLSAKYTHQQIRKNRGKQPGANIHMRGY